MNRKLERTKQALLTMLIAGSIMPASTPPATAANVTSVYGTALTLSHLKNGTFQVPNLACGYVNVQLTDGQGEADGIKVMFGRAVFGSLTGGHESDAVVHLAYRDPDFGWMQQLVFLTSDRHRVLQIGEYPIDDREQLKSFEIKDGELVVQTTLQQAEQAVTDKVTKIRLANTKDGVMLSATEWQVDSAAKKLVPFLDLQPYFCTVEEKIGKQWLPTRKDRGERVEVAFKIKESGEVEDVRVQSSSEVSSADQAALEAVAKAAPFPPLPTGSGKEIDMCLEFQAGVNLTRSHGG